MVLIKQLATEAASIDSKSIAVLLDQAFFTANNAKAAYESLKDHLVTAAYSLERVEQERKLIQERIAKEIKTHETSMEQLRVIAARWDIAPDEAKKQLAESRTAAIEAVKMLRAVQTVAQLNQVGSAIAAGADFSDLIE